MVKRVTAKEKVLAHLLNYHGQEDKYPQEVEITQEGISDTIGAKQNTVSYAVRELVKDGLLYKETTRVKGKKQRRKGYFLTSKGYKEAKEVTKKIEQIPIEIELEGEEKEILIQDVNKYFHTNLTPIEIYKESEKGRLSSELHTDETAPIQSLDGMLKPSHQEMKRLERLKDWSADGGSYLCVRGKEGAGKSTLLSQFADYLLQNHNTFYFKIKDWHTPRYLWEALGDFLSKTGEHKLSSYLNSHDRIGEREALDNLTEDLKLLGSSYFIIEDVEKNGDLKSMLIEILSDPELKKSTEEKRLHFIFPCSTEDRSMASKALPDFEHIVLEDEENGLYHQVSDYYKVDIDENPIPTVFNDNLTTEELDVVSYVSIFREPVKRKEVKHLKNINENLLTSVMNTPLLDSTYNDKLVTHDILKKVVQNTFPRNYLKQLHSRASDYYTNLTAKRTKESIETLYHLRESDRLDVLGDELMEFGDEILSAGHHEILLNILMSVELDELEEEDRNKIDYYLGESLRKSDDYEMALERFEDIVEGGEINELTIQAHFSMATIIEERDLEGAIDEFQQTLEMAQEFGGDKGMILASKSYLKLTRAFNQMGEYSKAKENLEKAIDILEKKDAFSLLTSSYFLMAQIEKNSGNWKKALEHFNKGINYRQKIDESYKRVAPLDDMVSVSRVMWDFENEEKFLTETVDICERFGYKRLKGSALLTLSEFYLDKGEPERAVDLAKSAKDIFKSLDKEEEEAYSHALLGQIYITLNEEDEAEDHIGRAISIYQKLGSSYSLGLAYFSMAKVQEKKGDNEGIAHNYRKALLSLTSSGADEMAKEVQRKMKTVPISM